MRSGVILLVEDSEDDVELALRAFEKNRIGNTIQVARDGEEALDYVFARGTFRGRDPGASPEVILLDLKLPRVDGIEVLRQVRGGEHTKLLPVVILTSSIEDGDRVAAYRGGANSYVRKPVDFLEFSETVRQLGLYWLTLNRPPPPARVP